MLAAAATETASHRRICAESAAVVPRRRPGRSEYARNAAAGPNSTLPLSVPATEIFTSRTWRAVKPGDHGAARIRVAVGAAVAPAVAVGPEQLQINFPNAAGPREVATLTPLADLAASRL